MEAGICYLSVAPLRKAPAHVSEMVSQLLFGETYRVLAYSENQEWIHIETDFDQYQGWLSVSQHVPMSDKYFHAFHLREHPIALAPVSIVLHDMGEIWLSTGSVLPFLEAGKILIEHTYFNLVTPQSEIQGNTPQEQIAWVAQRFQHVPYLWGGRSMFGLDCSGFMQLVARIMGIKLPRDAYLQAEIGQNIEFGAHATGDLAFFTNPLGKVVHVGLVLDSGRIIHASGKVKIDSLKDDGIYTIQGHKKTHHLSAIRRILEQ